MEARESSLVGGIKGGGKGGGPGRVTSGVHGGFLKALLLVFGFLYFFL